MKVSHDGKITGLKHFIALLPIVVIFIVASFLLVRNEILSLSTERISLISKSYAYRISAWADKTLRELEIFRNIADNAETLDDRTLELISTSYGSHEAYPYGIYVGDELGNYFDSSDWEPDADFVPSERDWYKEGVGNTEFTFGAPYRDEMTGDTCVSATVKVHNAEAETVMSADIYLDYPIRVASEAVTDDIQKAIFVTGTDKMILVSTEESETGTYLSEVSGPSLYRELSALIAGRKTGQFLLKSDGGCYVDINRIEGTDWFFVTFSGWYLVAQEMLFAEVLMFIIGLAGSTALILLTLRASNEMSETYRRAKTDPLTKLYNRDSFRTLTLISLKEEPARGALILFDMDNFKHINDHLGHPEGDEVLKAFAGLLEKYFNRGKDIAARLGGDEFAVFVGRNITHEEVSVMLGKFIEMFHKMFDEKYRGEGLAVSIGAAFMKDSGSYSAAYHNADTALYTAKQNGKNGFYITPEKPGEDENDEDAE